MNPPSDTRRGLHLVTHDEPAGQEQISEQLAAGVLNAATRMTVDERQKITDIE